MYEGLPRWNSGKESDCQCRRCKRCVFASGINSRSSGVGNGSPLQYSCLGNSLDRWAWWPAVHGITKNWTDWVTEHPRTHTYMNGFISEISVLFHWFIFHVFCPNDAVLISVMTLKSSLKSGSVIYPTFSQDCSGYTWSFITPYIFTNFLFCFCERMSLGFL